MNREARAWRVVAVVLVLLLAVALRMPGQRWGLPNSDHYLSYHPDEIFQLLPAFRFAQGDLNPRFFNYGSAYLYTVGIPAVALGIVPGRARFPDDLCRLYQWGRLVTLMMAVASVAVLYLALRRTDRRQALLAALLLALCPLHVANSSYATVDVPAAFWLVVAFLVVLRAGDRPRAGEGVLAGLAVGIATATKYNMGLFLLPALAAPLLAALRWWRWWWPAAVASGAVFGFVIGCPYFWTPEFLNGLLYEVQHARIGGTLAFVDTGSGWGYHLVRGLSTGLGYPLLAISAIGLAVALGRRTPAGMLSVVWLICYLAVIGFGKERFIRYLVPLTPFLCVLAAGGLDWLARTCRARRAQWVGGAVAVAGLVLVALYSFGQVVPFAWLDPRDEAWMQSEVPLRQARVGLVGPPWFSDPPVSPYNGGPLTKALFEQWNRANGERVVVTGWDVGALAALTPHVFVLSDLVTRDQLRLATPEGLEARRFVSALDSWYAERMELGPPPAPFSWLGPGRRRAPPDWLYPSPRLTVYYSPRP